MLRGDLARTMGSGNSTAIDVQGAQGEWKGDGLRIRDPNDSNNNPGRSTTNFKAIQEVCRCELNRQIQEITQMANCQQQQSW